MGHKKVMNQSKFNHADKTVHFSPKKRLPKTVSKAVTLKRVFWMLLSKWTWTEMMMLHGDAPLRWVCGFVAQSFVQLTCVLRPGNGHSVAAKV